MKILPATGSDWLGLLLIPFKVFVPAGYLLILFQRDVLGHRQETGDITLFVLSGYLVTFLMLVIGAMIQHSIGARRAYLSTCGFIIALFVFGLLLLPHLAHT